ncbi:hypothetical protein AK812_SmicGene32077 [Symbiodinium microadriaticum]|uniref:Uncharacterized protein n=1 Tax=Symbiodinium microadriaticum TaxID=2951 RepID=A0A1Q9CV45_SYMMI|nr:hypothetical protein AK812_SmicGene32077 [Symbiodinium microadriaticum]
MSMPNVNLKAISEALVSCKDSLCSFDLPQAVPVPGRSLPGLGKATCRRKQLQARSQEGSVVPALAVLAQWIGNPRLWMSLARVERFMSIARKDRHILSSSAFYGASPLDHCRSSRLLAMGRWHWLGLWLFLHEVTQPPLVEPPTPRDVERRQRLHRWPNFPADVVDTFRQWGVEPRLLASEVPALRAGGAVDVDERMRFLTSVLRRSVASLAEHPQFLWSRFEAHILPRALYADQLGLAQVIGLRDLLGTRDTALQDAKAWPAVCGPKASRADYEELHRQVQQLASHSAPLLPLTLAEGLDGLRRRLSAPPVTSKGPP